MPPSVSLRPNAALAAAKIPKASLLDSLFYNLAHVLPAYLRGLFTPNRFWTTLFTAIQPDAAAVKFVSRLRRKYHSNYFYLRLLTTQSLVVLDRDGIRHVLDHSPTIYADAKTKRVGMSHFQPHALTLSRGEDWRERRRFNEAVLDSGEGLHHCAHAFLEVIKNETAAALDEADDELGWDDVAALFERIGIQIIFGPGIRDAALMQDLRRMMREANRGFLLKKSRYFDEFYAGLRQHRERANTRSLAALCRHAPTTERTRIDNQIPHWMFAMCDTLAINTARAFALIVAHPEAEAKVRTEMAGADVGAAQGIHALRYLEGCVQEAMRLWPTTPILARETLREDMLGGVTIPSGTQVLILNSFNHRDRETLAYADSFSPQIWLHGEPDYLFNHLSNGTQVCAGKELALFIAKAVLSGLLAGQRYALIRPTLDPSRPLPYLYNHFHIRLQRKDA